VEAGVADNGLRAGAVDVPVLIVGGGPVGLALAVEVGIRDVPCLLVERGDGSVPVPKMTQLTTRTMEFCRRWGIIDQVKAAAWPPEHPGDFVYMTSLTGFELWRQPVPRYADRRESPYTPELTRQCPQIFFDPILLNHARSLSPVTLRNRTELESFEQVDGHVVAHLRDLETEEARTVTSRYLVGCDGFDGVVRKAIGVEYEGSGILSFSVSIYFRSPELIIHHDKGWSRFYRLVDSSGHWGDLIAIDGRELYRLTMLDLDPDTDLDSFDVAGYMRRAAGRDFTYEVFSVLPWKRRELVADRFRSGNVFIAGDAAHQMSPTGGLGMNTGVADAVDLGWKLAAVFDGWGGERLLDSYEIERKPVAVTAVTASSKAYQETVSLPVGPEIADDSPVGQEQRQRFAGAFAGLLPVSEPITEQTKLGYCYEDSPIICSDGTVGPPEDSRTFIPSARPGTRAPHAWVAPGKSTLDLFGDGFVMLRVGRNPPSVASLFVAATTKGVAVQVIDVLNPDTAALDEPRLVLGRPDGHIAWRGDSLPEDLEGFVDRVRGAG
jgi:2-polyprenyl-6-methoxyphenol hydroxylase-like FAD-dependent oxidoreductase